MQEEENIVNKDHRVIRQILLSLSEAKRDMYFGLCRRRKIWIAECNFANEIWWTQDATLNYFVDRLRYAFYYSAELNGNHWSGFLHEFLEAFEHIHEVRLN